MTKSFTPELIYEGQCPHGHGPLARRDYYGWCDTCRYGWSASNDVWTLHNPISGRITVPTSGRHILTYLNDNGIKKTTLSGTMKGDT